MEEKARGRSPFVEEYQQPASHLRRRKVRRMSASAGGCSYARSDHAVSAGGNGRGNTAVAGYDRHARSSVDRGPYQAAQEEADSISSAR